MIQIKKPKYEHDNYCACCRKPFEDSMQISFSHKDYKDSVSITLCGKCREELRKALGKDINVPSKSALDHIHNVVAENAFNKGYDAGHAEGYERGKTDATISASMLAKRLMEKFDDVLSVADVLEELEMVEKGEGYEQGKKDAAPTWIPTSERVPSNNDTVLIVHKGGVSTGWWNGRYWERGASSNHRMLKTVTHWMPFPEAPKGE